MLNLPYCNTDCFQLFLNEFSQCEPNELKVVVLDNGAFHKAKRLIVPKNILLIFLPPYSPELNPAEKMWQKFKRNFTNKLFKSLEEVQAFICEQSDLNTKSSTKSICQYQYIGKQLLAFYIIHFDIISQRTKEALDAAKKRGVELGKNGKQLALDNKQSSIAFRLQMKPIIEGLKQEGFITIAAITNELNCRRIATFRHGAKWHRSTVHAVAK